MILPAGSGNTTVLMTREEYNGKLEHATVQYQHLYGILWKDPTTAQEARIGHVLRDYVRKNEIINELYNWLMPCGFLPPRIYGFSRILMDGAPLRPIASGINPPAF